ncbi:glycosyltransferase [Dyella japonica]|uniref:Glycosyltransferase involved in cell wall biosynthesis n=1 Tax=Dyella japonica TaxID=231455 RepID=A0ABV2JW48_9GAMM
MKIVIDIQGAQSESRHRGIGRHTAALVRAFAREADGKHDVWIVANASLGHVEAVRAAVDGLIPQERIVSFAVPGQVASMDAAHAPLTNAAELIREDFLRSLNADIVWCSSLFEGWVDNSVTSMGRLSSDAVRAVTLYDLIPLSDTAAHLSNPSVRAWYYRKLSQLQRSDVLLAISDYARQEAIELLNISPDRVHTISSAADECFRPLPDEERQRAVQGLEIGRPFVLYMGGFDSRKNVELLVRAFASLPRELRGRHALVLAGKVTASRESVLRALASRHGLGAMDVVFTRELTDNDLVTLYNQCSLFVFPSLQEGFGLPVLEAMACGAPVLAANATSLPEVVGRSDMLFDPVDAPSLASKMEAVLSQPGLAQEYRQHGLVQAKQFSWEACARRAMQAFEAKAKPATTTVPASRTQIAKPRMAFISPLPPERTGIADYSAELLPSLDRYYDIDVVVDQKTVGDPWVVANYPVRDAAWFRSHAHLFDRVLYQLGNSTFHLYQLDLLRDFPGVVVLHDSFIGALSQWRAVHGAGDREYLRRLYRAHGYEALLADKELGRSWTINHYPSSWEVIENAAGVLVHSQYAMDQVRRAYGASVAQEMRHVAFPKHRRASARDVSRKALGLKPDDFVVCSFGMVAPTKLNHCLLSAWLSSSLAKDALCHLVFVGENHGGDYGRELLATIAASTAANRIRITGFVDHAQYHAWLEAADVAVQLRTESRGETSAAVFDCMAQALPVIVNAHATFAELDASAVCMLPDLFDNGDLAIALATLHDDPLKRKALSEQARHVIDARHHPSVVATQYRQAIEAFSSHHFLAREHELYRRFASIDGLPEEKLWDIAAAVRGNRRPRGKRKLFVDVTAVARNDLKTGIERVTRNVSTELLRARIEDTRVELVRFQDGHYVYCRDYACQLLGVPELELPDEVIDVAPGDIFFGLDWVADVVPGNRALYQSWRDRGATVYFLVYDLLPVLRPEFFPAGIDRMHGQWLTSVASIADGAICISRTVADELQEWLSRKGIVRARPLAIGYSYLGAELDARPDVVAGESILSERVASVVAGARAAPTVLMVGTMEPRKGHRLALAAFEQLWAEGRDIHLVIVGKLGWMMDSLGEQVRAHAQYGRRLHWLVGIDDNELRALYRSSRALLVASEGEGFGLPIIEAALNGIPVIARDLPVFREVAGNAAHYFKGSDPRHLKEAVLAWFALDEQGAALAPAAIPQLSWRDSALAMMGLVTDRHHPQWLYAWQAGEPLNPLVDASGLILSLSQASPDLLRRGWGDPEDWGCWAIGAAASLKVDVEAQEGAALQFTVVARAFVSASHPQQSFELQANGQTVGSWTHRYGEDFTEQRFVLPALPRDRPTLELTVIQKDAISPKALGDSPDGRQLGLAVKELGFTWINHGNT